MYTLFTILVIIGAIFTFILLLAAFAPVNFVITREVIINKPVKEVFSYLRMLRNGEKYNKWVMTDPNMKKEFKGSDGNAGFIYAWDSTNKQVGKGEQEITKITEDKKIESAIRFERPFVATSQTWFTTEAAGDNTTRVTWVFSGSNSYLMRVVHVMLNLKKVLGRDMQLSLNKLKLILEK